jgi:hypothetical protein
VWLCYREYTTITKTYAINAAKAFSQLLPSPEINTSRSPFRFIFVSGLSANHSPGLFTPLQGRVKGETEILLSRLVTESFHIVALRPGAVDARGHTAIASFIPEPGALARYVRAAALPLIGRYAELHSPTNELGRCLVSMAMGKFDARIHKEQAQSGDIIRVEGGLRVVTNSAMRRWMAEERPE